MDQEEIKVEVEVLKRDGYYYWCSIPEFTLPQINDMEKLDEKAGQIWELASQLIKYYREN
jgi:hypothetical protein